MATTRTITVYCGAREPKNPVYAREVIKLGATLAARGVSVVFGGSNFGLLGKMADSALSNGGKVTGIIPEFFTKMESYKAVGEEIVVPDMHTRKKMMFDRSDAFIALPGGLGTMEELTEILTWSKLNLHNKPVAILNTNGFYNSFLSWVSNAIEEGFIPGAGEGVRVDSLMVISDTAPELVDKLLLRLREEESLAQGPSNHVQEEESCS